MMKTKIKSNRGFTLIELMIAIAIIGILAAVALPAYSDYVIRAKRVEATGLLLELSSFMERFFTENGQYHQDRDVAPVAVALPFIQSPKDGGIAAYNIAFSTAATATVFTITATPVGKQVSDTDCDAVSIDQTGTKCILGGAKCSDGTAADKDAVADCW